MVSAEEVEEEVEVVEEGEVKAMNIIGLMYVSIYFLEFQFPFFLFFFGLFFVEAYILRDNQRHEIKFVECNIIKPIMQLSFVFE